MQVLDDVGQQVGAVHTAARRLVAQLGEVKVQVVVRRLVVQVGPQFAGRKVVLLKDDFLNHQARQETFVKTLETSERSKSLVVNSRSMIITKPHLSFLEDVLQQRQMVRRQVSETSNVPLIHDGNQIQIIHLEIEKS